MRFFILPYKRLFQENAAKGFLGNTFNDTDWNETIEYLLGFQDREGVFGLYYDPMADDYYYDLGNGVEIGEFAYNSDGELSMFLIHYSFRTKEVPLYPDETNQRYSNDWLMSKTIDNSQTGFTVLDHQGMVVDDSNFTLNNDGSLSFQTPQSYPYLLIKDLFYKEILWVRLYRDEDTRAIQSFDLNWLTKE